MKVTRTHFEFGQSSRNCFKTKNKRNKLEKNRDQQFNRIQQILVLKTNQNPFKFQLSFFDMANYEVITDSKIMQMECVGSIIGQRANSLFHKT